MSAHRAPKQDDTKCSDTIRVSRHMHVTSNTGNKKNTTQVASTLVQSAVTCMSANRAPKKKKIKNTQHVSYTSCRHVFIRNKRKKNTSCDIEDSVDTHICKLFVILRLHVLTGFICFHVGCMYPLLRGTYSNMMLQDSERACVHKFV